MGIGKFMAQGSIASGEFRFGGKVLIASLIGVALGASPIPFNSIGLVIGPISKEYGWSVEQVANGITIFGIIAALLAPLYGGLADRIGVRAVTLWSLFGFGVSFALLGFAPNNIWVYYGLWALVGLVGIGSTPVTFSRGVSQWFAQSRGLALGIMLLGTSLTAIFVPWLGKQIIVNWGWRALFPSFGALTLLIALPLGFFWFREPTAQERPKGMNDASGNLIGTRFGQAIKTRYFWIMVASTILISTAYGGAHVHMVEMVKKHGFSADMAAGVAMIVGVGILIGRVSVGLLFDRFWAPGVAFIVLSLPALSSYLFMGGHSDLAVLKIAAFLLGLAAGAESDVLAFLTARYFGMLNYGRIYGAFYLFFGICSGISPKLYSRAVGNSGSYDPMLQAAIFCFLGGAALLLLLGRYPPEYGMRADELSPQKDMIDGNPAPQ
jgi:MFS transporter, OFA family, oxalate/formate antiporter